MFQSRVKLKSTQDRTRQCPLQVDTFPEYCEELAPQAVTNETKEEETEGGIDAWEAWAHYETSKEEDDDEEHGGDGEDAKEEDDDEEHGGDGEAPDAAAGGGDATDADAAAADPTHADAAAADPADEHADGADPTHADAAAADPADEHADGADPTHADAAAADPADEHADGAGPADAHAGAHTAPWRWNNRRWKHGKGNGKGQKGKQKGKQKGNQKGNHGKGNHGKGNQKGGKGRGGRGRNQSGTGKGAGGDHGGASSSTLALMSSWIVFQVAQHTHVNLKRVAVVIVPSVCTHWLSYISGSGHGAVAHAPKPWWAYRGEKRSSKAHPVGQEDQWGGRYVEGGYEIGGQVYPLLGSSYL